MAEQATGAGDAFDAIVETTDNVVPSEEWPSADERGAAKRAQERASLEAAVAKTEAKAKAAKEALAAFDKG